MADRINDTDPQSPNALGSRTDPGLGAPAVLAPSRVSPLPPIVAAPSQGAASIEELLDGITGPRPPPSRRDAAPDAARAYVAARPVPAPQPMAPHEPLVLSPDPPLYSGAGREPRDLDEPRESSKKLDPESTRPVVRRGREAETGPNGRPAEERTVYTGRRAVLRSAGVAVGSAALVALMMLTIMRWKEAHRPPRTPEVVVLPAVQESEAPGVAPVAAAAIATPAVIATSEPVAVPTATPPSPRPATSAPRRRANGEAKAPKGDSLDDLNRQISH